MKLEIKTATLSNGLRVVVNEDQLSTMVASAIVYQASNRTERKGITGISHILEHMMYKGTKKIGPEDYSQKIKRLGGYDNAFTSKDYTAFYAYLPCEALEDFLEMEADRMVNLELRDFESELEVIKDERRYISQDNPVEYFMEIYWSKLFKVHPYGYPIIGFEEDLNNLKRDDVLNYYNTYYTPANSMLVIAGKVKFEEVLELVDKHFGGINKKSDFKIDPPVEPPQESKDVVRVERKRVSPIVVLGFKTVPFPHPKKYAYDLLSEILCGGKWGILVRELVYEKNIFAGLSCEATFLLDHGVFLIVGIPSPRVKIDNAVNILEDRLFNAKERIREDLLIAAKNKLMTEFYFDLESVRDVVFELAEYSLAGILEELNEYPERLERVRLDDLKEIMNLNFVPEKETLGILSRG